MYNAQDLGERIKSQAREKNILIRDLLTSCDLSINTIIQMTDKKGLSSFSLAKIADYLECSVDYLLGRTDNPE
ncbi:MAG: helix-turn-helix domain-containing protein, partial [Ruminococcus sp.]